MTWNMHPSRNHVSLGDVTLTVVKMLAVTLFAIPIGCATVPRESVSLSQTIGQRINATHTSYLGLLEEYFRLRRQLIDTWIRESYLSSYMKNLYKEAEKTGESINFLDPKITGEIFTTLITRRNQMQFELDKAKIVLINRINTDHEILVQANNTLRDLLASMVEQDHINLPWINPENIGDIHLDYAHLSQILDKYLIHDQTTKQTIPLWHAKVKQFVKPGPHNE